MHPYLNLCPHHRKDKMFCCDLLKICLDDIRVPLEYSPSFREYTIPLKGRVARQGISFCPWCGVKLPEDLRDEWIDILEKEYGIEDPFFVRMDGGDLPKDFLSDEWWKKRNL